MKFQMVWTRGIKIYDIDKIDESIIRPYPWGFEVRADFVDDDGRIYNEAYHYFGKEPPSVKQIQGSIAASIPRLEAEAAAAKAMIVEPDVPIDQTKVDLFKKLNDVLVMIEKTDTKAADALKEAMDGYSLTAKESEAVSADKVGG